MLVLAALVVVGAGVYLWHQVKPLLERNMTLRERVMAPAPVAPSEQMPDDLLFYGLGAQEAWAREDAQSRLRQLFHEIGDWDRVRLVVAQEEAARIADAQRTLSEYVTRGVPNA